MKKFTPYDPNNSLADWTAEVESQWGGWIDAMIDLDVNTTERGRQVTKLNFLNVGVIVEYTGSNPTWTLVSDFNHDKYEQLGDF